MKPTLLIAEPDGELSDVMQRYLTNHGFRVETASDGLECLALLRMMPCQLLVLNLNLPWGGGDGVLDVLRHEPGMRDLPVIVTSANVAISDDELLEVRRRPVVELLWKPYSLATLVECVQSVTAKGPLTSLRRRTPERSLAGVGA